MIRSNPFDNRPKNPTTNNPQNFSNNEQSNTSILPPKKNQIHSNTTPFPSNQNSNNLQQANNNYSNNISNTFSNYSNNTNDTNSNSFRNNSNYSNYSYSEQSNDEFETIKSEYELKYKPLNSSKEYISLTTEIFPSNNITLEQSNVPLGISICPMKNSQNELPLIDYGSHPIPRCSNTKCRAYLNPFVKFIDGGEKWICNLCGQINNTEEFYYCDVDKNGIRNDINTKVELSCGSYEFATDKSYWKKGKQPTQAFFIFLLETSFSAIDNGFLSACIESIKDVINNELFYNGNNVKIAIISYNQSVDFYSYNDKFTQPQMLTVNDEQIFLPTYKDNLIFDIQKDKDKILQILDLIQNNFNRNNQNILNNNCKDSTLIFTSIVAAYLLGKGTGGKLIVFSSSNSLSLLPKMNGGIDKNATKEQISYSAHDKRQLGNMGINLTNENMSCDIFASADNKINTLTLNQICEYSNGNLYFYKKFNINLHYKNIFNQIRRVLSRPISWEATNKLRFSHNFEIIQYQTPTLIIEGSIFVFPEGDSDQNYLFTIGPKKKKITENESNENKNDFNITSKEPYLFIQSALLYSYGDGTRRVRVHNYSVPVTNNIKYIYEGINAELLANYYLKDTINRIYSSKNIANAIITTDTQFKIFIDKVMSTQQKMQKTLLENLDFLPLYMLGMFKHRIFCKNEVEKNYDLDISNSLRIRLQKMSPSEIINFICPTIYSLHEIETNKDLGTYNNENGEFNIPPVISLSKNSMEENGLYLIDNGYLLIIYMKKNASNNILKNLFGVNSIEEALNLTINEDLVFDGEDNNEFKEKIRNILDYVRGNKSLYQNLIFVFEGAGNERIINESLIEDNYCNWFPMDYTNFYKKYVQQSSNTFGY